MKPAIVLLLLLCAAALAHADAPTFVFGGETYVKKFEVQGTAPNAQVEFGLATESLEDWTRLVTLHSFTQSGNDPERAAAALANLVRENYKGAPLRLMASPQSTEAIIDFLISAPNSNVMELNVFKYARAGDGLVAFQFARRIKFGEVDGAALRDIRERAINEIAPYDMGPVRAFFGKGP
jgi:hypothetical protein